MALHLVDKENTLRDAFANWIKAKAVLGLVDADVSGMTGTFAGLLAMLAAKSCHVVYKNFRDHELVNALTAANTVGTLSDAACSTAQGTGTLAAVDSIFTTANSALAAASGGVAMPIPFG
jgi:hypothetical protein